MLYCFKLGLYAPMGIASSQVEAFNRGVNAVNSIISYDVIFFAYLTRLGRNHYNAVVQPAHNLNQLIDTQTSTYIKYALRLYI